MKRIKSLWGRSTPAITPDPSAPTGAAESRQLLEELDKARKCLIAERRRYAQMQRLLLSNLEAQQVAIQQLREAVMGNLGIQLKPHEAPSR